MHTSEVALASGIPYPCSDLTSISRPRLVFRSMKPIPQEDYLYFVSYARDDYYIAGAAGLEENAFLKQFFTDLHETTRLLAGRLQIDAIDYRDTEQIDLGKPWRSEVLKGLQNCRCLVALYTPLFFNRPECGKEVKFMQ